MTNAFYKIIMKFGEGVNMQAEFLAVIGWFVGAIFLVALIFCFFGFKTYRVIAALMVFLLVALGFIAIMQARQSIGAIVITFTLMGIIAGFLVFQWYRVAGFVIGGLIGYSLVTLLTGNLWVALAVALILAIVAAIYTTVLVVIATSVWGGLVLALKGLPELGVEQLWIKILVAVLLIVAGLVVQYFTNKKALKKEVNAN